MRWFNARLIVLAPLLSLVDAVDGAPAGALAAGSHRRANVDNPDSPWHRRYAASKRQTDLGVDVPVVDVDAPSNDGPPTVITVSVSESSSSTASTEPANPTEPATPTEPESPVNVGDSVSNSSSSTSTSESTSASTSESSFTGTSESSSTSTSESTSASTSESSSTSTSESSSTSTSETSSAPTSDSSTSTTTTSSTVDTTIAEPSSSSSSESPPISLSISLPLPTEDPPSSTSETPAPTDPPPPASTSESSTSAAPTDPPTISISISLPPISDPGNSTSVDPPFTFTPPPETTTSTPIVNPPTGSPSFTESPTGDPTPPSSPTPSPSGSSSDSGILTLPTNIFPSNSISGGVITTESDSTSSRPSISLEAQYSFITATTFLVGPAATTDSASVTNTDPDAVLTSNSLQTGPSATVTGAILPTTIPMFIAPPPSSDHVDPHTALDGYTEISILFQSTASWVWILQHSDTAAQILAYMSPIIISSLSGLGATRADVKTIGLSAFEPANTDTADDLMTMWVGLIKTEFVSPLAAMIKATPTSEFYNTGDPIAQSIAKNVVAAYNIATLNGVSNEDGSSASSGNQQTVVDNSRRNAIIGVSTAFGLIALIVFVWWIVKSYRARHEGMHKRLSYDGATNYGAAGAGVSAGAGYGDGYGGGSGAGGVRAESPPALHNPFMTEREREEEARGIRRNSFYAIGPDDASIEEETFDYMSQRSSTGATGLNRATSGNSGNARWLVGGNGAGAGGLTVPGAHQGAVRRPVVGQQISQPILRESSMGNW